MSLLQGHPPLSRRTLLGRLALTVTGLIAPWPLFRARPARAGAPAPSGQGHPDAPGEGLFANLEGDRLLLTVRLSKDAPGGFAEDPWRALFVTAIEPHTQRPLCRHVASPGQIEILPATAIESHGAGPAHVRSHATVRLRQLLPELGTHSAYLVHASLLQHRSGVLWMAAPS
jgi:hypothetical protein